LTVVAEKAIFPHYPGTEARLEDLPKEESFSSPSSYGRAGMALPYPILKGE